MYEGRSVKFRFDEKLYLEGAELSYDISMKEGWRRYTGWLFIALLQFGVVSALVGGRFALLFLSTILVIYWYYLRWPLRKAALARIFEKSPYADRTLSIVPEDGGLCIDDKCVPWFEFDRVIYRDGNFLFDMGDSILYIPSTAFADSEERSQFASFIREKVERFEKVERA